MAAAACLRVVALVLIVACADAKYLGWRKSLFSQGVGIASDNQTAAYFGACDISPHLAQHFLKVLGNGGTMI